MTQQELNRSVARATGEDVCTIASMGFSVADPTLVRHDPEPSPFEDRIIDWDTVQHRRHVAVFA
jgi:hypothetical protein